jgi:hypothetical protein
MISCRERVAGKCKELIIYDRESGRVVGGCGKGRLLLAVCQRYAGTGRTCWGEPAGGGRLCKMASVVRPEGY